jgi:hypothetical protein
LNNSIILIIYSQVTASIIRLRIQLENRIEQELEAFINWLKKFTDQSKGMDRQVKRKKKFVQSNICLIDHPIKLKRTRRTL